MTITLTRDQANDILAALIRMEHKTTGSMEYSEYWAAVALAQALDAPQFVTEYFAGKAATAALGNEIELPKELT